MQQVHVAVGIICNADNQVLVSLRPDHVHQGGLWEFPGGKVETGESVEAALTRELQEELGIQPLAFNVFNSLHHRYADKRVLLDIFRVTEFSGTPHGREGQLVKWLDVNELSPEMFPAANASIIRALQLPEAFMITGQFEDNDDFLQRLQASLENGIRLVQLRAKHLSSEQTRSLASAAQALCKRYQARLLVNMSPDEFDTAIADGLHLTSQQLYALSQRPFDHNCLLSASCHTAEDLEQARRIGADFVLLSPVKETRSHPGVAGIGWSAFSEMIENVNVPVYALGGMSSDDINIAKQHGAQGVAAISSFWA